MPSGASVELSTLEKLGEISTTSQYMNYPNLYQRHLIPDDALRVLNSRWCADRIALPNVEFHIARQVYVVDEGLVFTADGALISATRINFNDAQVTHARETLARALENPESIQRHSKAILCKKRGASNYGHWLVEMLPKAYWVMRKLNVRDWPVAVQKDGPEMNAIVLQSLAAIGLEAEKIIETTSSPIYFEELLLVHGLTSHAIHLSPLVMECMEFIASKAPPGTAEAVYAVRRPANVRDFEHESDAREIFLRHGYKEVETASLTFLQQVSAFKSAKRVVGAMGAALTNTIFCRPGTEILMFAPASALELFFWHIAEGKKLDYHEVRTEESGPPAGGLPWNRSLRISGHALETILEMLEKKRLLPTRALEPTPAFVTRERSCSMTWKLTFSNDFNQTHVIRLNLDGTISGYQNQNEDSWRFNAGTIELISSTGMLIWRFDDINIRNGKLRLRAICSIPGLSGILAILEEFAP